MNNILSALGGVDKLIKFVLYLVIAIAIYVAAKSLYTAYKRRNAGLVYVNSDHLDPSKNYDTYAKDVNDAFDNWFNSSEEMEACAASLLLLNNDELREVSNRYKKLYGSGSRNLSDAIADYYLCISCDSVNALHVRIQTIGIL